MCFQKKKIESPRCIERGKKMLIINNRKFFSVAFFFVHGNNGTYACNKSHYLWTHSFYYNNKEESNKNKLYAMEQSIQSSFICDECNQKNCNSEGCIVYSNLMLFYALFIIFVEIQWLETLVHLMIEWYRWV